MSDRLGILDRVLAWIGDKPWKAFAIVVAVLILGAGWVLYEKRDTLLEAWLTPSTPELRTSLIPEALAKLAAPRPTPISCRSGLSI